MALKESQLLTILITTLLGASTALTWNPNIHRYESYDLEKGPVFYEAYYPDSSDESDKSYQEKRYFDRGTVLERTYQVPSERFAYTNNNLRVDSYQNPTGRLQYPDGYVDPRYTLTGKNAEAERVRSLPPDQDYATRNNVLRIRTGDETVFEGTRDDRFVNRPSTRSLDIKEISSLARRAISRDLENWNALEGYLDRTDYQDQRRSYRRPNADVDFRRNNAVDDRTLLDSSKVVRETRIGPYEKVREDPTEDRIESSDVIRRHDARDLSFEPIRYANERIYQREPSKSRFELPADGTATQNFQTPYPTENIFEPRPQVINYIFSKKSGETAENKAEDAQPAKTTAVERAPRNYGDNLIQEEMKKTEVGKDVKVTSIEISEVPRHKTRHHHGEWPKRDYSHRHQS